MKQHGMKSMVVGIIICLVFLAASAASVIAQLSTDALVQDLRWRNIGPANMMGRIAAIDALDTDYRHVLIATASGGVYKSLNGGMSWEIIFDNYGVGSIGSVAIFQANPDIIWVGTGEAANRNSSGWGDGIYKSTDGGISFNYMGLSDTHHIAEIALHPTNPDIAYVAAMGHLWGYSGIRGLFKTTDGGQSWEKLTGGLPDDKKTGCTEVVIHPGNPDILFTGFYHRIRQPATFYSGGGNGGLFKSENGGKSWRKITRGLAPGSNGMIDISIHLKNPDIMVMAYEAEESLNNDGYTLTRKDLSTGQVDKEEINSPGSGVYRSDDGGESWQFILKHAVRPFYHGQIAIDPVDPQKIYVVSRDFRISLDGGKTFNVRKWQTDGGDDHDIWIAPYDNKIIYLATDQGAKLTIDGGHSFLSFNNMAIGQYYAIGVDMRDPYRVVGGLQDNGEWIITSNSRDTKGILNRHASVLGGGDGFHCQVDPEDWRTVYIVSHVGFAARINPETGEHVFITPTPETIVNFNDYADPDFAEDPIQYTIDPGEYWFFGGNPERPLLPPQFRFNWSSPLVLSPINPMTIYFGGNYLFKSENRGETWRIISSDLTSNDPKLRNTSNGGGLTNSNTGGENHFTIVTISESPLDDNIVWVGTDDGNVQLTLNGGVSWTNLKSAFPGIPDKIWVSRVESSHHLKGTAYVTFDNHRYDDMKPYVFKTADFGKTWKNISGNLPESYSVYVIREDFINQDLLFTGTEAAVYYSIDAGNSWARLMENMPSVAVHDLIIHPRDADLVAGTHGRSIWICDDITPLRQINAEIMDKELHVFESRISTKWLKWNTGRTQPAFEFRGENPPYGALINFFLKEEPVNDVTITVEEFLGERRQEFNYKAHKGINRVSWDFMFHTTVSERLLVKDHLNYVVDELGSRVEKAGLPNSLKAIRIQLKRAETDRQLNEVRRRLMNTYSIYTNGELFFGNKIGQTEATAGEYKVTVTVKDISESIKIIIQDDPLLKK